MQTFEALFPLVGPGQRAISVTGEGTIEEMGPYFNIGPCAYYKRKPQMAFDSAKTNFTS